MNLAHEWELLMELTKEMKLARGWELLMELSTEVSLKESKLAWLREMCFECLLAPLREMPSAFLREKNLVYSSAVTMALLRELM